VCRYPMASFASTIEMNVKLAEGQVSVPGVRAKAVGCVRDRGTVQIVAGRDYNQRGEVT